MNRTATWLTIWMVLLVALVTTLSILAQEVSEKPGWDGTYECRPGETYTTEECK